jgi:hypothetical protein
MNNQLIISTLAVGFLAGLGIAAVRGDFSHPAAAPAAAPVAEPPEQLAAVPQQVVAVGPATPAPPADAALPLQSAAPEAPASDPQPDGDESADAPPALPAPTYDDQTVAHERAAAHGARSR